MRIGIFTDQYFPTVSGVVTSIETLADGLRARGHIVYIITKNVCSYLCKALSFI